MTAVDELKSRLAERQQQTQEIQTRLQKEVQPLVREMVERRVALVQYLDQFYSQTDLPKLEQEKLAGFIKNQASFLVQHHDAQEMEEILRRYSEPVPNSAARPDKNSAKEETQHLLKHVLGLDVQLQDLQDLEAFQARLDQQMQEEQEKREAQRTHRQKEKAQQSKEVKLKKELESISKASRRLYTTLAKLLHPDTERDETARHWKEEAMKKVTVAYHQDDFFELLRLQMEFMHEQEQVLAKVPEDQLAYYVRLLQEQLQELEEEQGEFHLGTAGQLLQDFGGTAKQREAKFRAAKRGLKEEIQQLEFALADFQDPAAVRAFIKGLSL